MAQTGEAPVALIVGTRPEGIKIAPVYLALKRAGVPVILCSLAATDPAVCEVFQAFNIVPDREFDTAYRIKDPSLVVQTVLREVNAWLVEMVPSLLLIQGDSTSAMAAALAGFYVNIPVGHVEAGLRTDDVRAPYPEELNRRVISLVSTYHFAPTPAAVANVLSHGVRRDQVFCTGNTGVDALHLIRDKIATRSMVIDSQVRDFVRSAGERNRELAILCVDRTEIVQDGITSILSAIAHYAKKNKRVRWLYIYGSDVQVIEEIARIGLADLSNILLVERLAYPDMVYALDAADMVLTDSGSLQEEAASLNKPVVVLRSKTERMEGVLSGNAWVVGTSEQCVLDGIKCAREKNCDEKRYVHVREDGHSAEKIVAFIQVRYEQLQQRNLIHSVVDANNAVVQSIKFENKRAESM